MSRNKTKLPSFTLKLPNIDSHNICSTRKFSGKNFEKIVRYLFDDFFDAQAILISLLRNFNFNDKKKEFQKIDISDVRIVDELFEKYRTKDSDKDKIHKKIDKEMDRQWKEFKNNVCDLYQRYWNIFDDVEQGKIDDPDTKAEIERWILAVDLLSLNFLHLRKLDEHYDAFFKGR